MSDNFYTSDYIKDHGLDNVVSAGEFTYGKPNILHWGEAAVLNIGKFCSVADNVTILLGGNHRLDWITTYPFSALTDVWAEAAGIEGHPATNGNVLIGNDVWIGRGATILSGVSIGDGAVIGCNALVSMDVEAYSIVAGNPATVIRKRFTDSEIKNLLEMKWWDWDVNVIRKYMHQLCSGDIASLHKSWTNLQAGL